MYPCDQPQSLITKTFVLLKEDERSLADISIRAQIPYFWLESFSKGKVKNPGINRVQYLYEFLTGKKLIEG